MAARWKPWPNGARVAILFTVPFEVWSDGHGPSYSTQTTHLKSGAIDHSSVSFARYGGKAGVPRLLDLFDRHGVPATFAMSAKCCSDFPDAVRAIAAAGHDIAGHGITQDELQAYMTPDEERACVKRSLDTIESFTGTRPAGWLCPVHAWTPATTGILAEAGLLYQSDAKDIDAPCVTAVDGKRIVQIPPSEFADNRVLRASPRAFYDVYKDTFDYLYKHEPGSLLTMTLHAHNGGRPPITAMVEELMAYWKTQPDVWFARHREIAQITLAGTREPAGA